MWSRVLSSQDLYLHISVGNWILQHHMVPDHGIFSSSRPDAPWLAHEWLASLAIAALYDAFSWNGLLVATAAMLALAVGIVAFEVSRATSAPIALVCGLLVWGLCLGHTLARPHVATFPLFAFWIATHVRARRQNRTPPVGVAALMVVWANIHGSFIIGPVFTCMFAAEEVVEASSLRQATAALLRWSGFLAATIAFALVTPFGLDGVVFPFTLLAKSTALAGITEWQPSSAANNLPLIVWMILLLFVLLVRGTTVRVSRAAMFILLLYMAFAHQRFTELLALATPLLLLDDFADAYPEKSDLPVTAYDPFEMRFVVPTICLALFVAPVVSLTVISRYQRHGSDKFTPEKAIDWVAKHRLEGSLMNAYNFAGYLIFRGYAPFIDGRVELYGNEFVTEYFTLDQFPALLDRYHISWTIFEPLNPRNVMLDQMPGWARAYADGDAVIHVRQQSSRAE
jgi:hypothetical protein